MPELALIHTYKPRGACLALMKNRGAEVLLSGPAGTGKSRACLEKLHLMMLMNPGSRGLMLRKTAVSLTGSALVTWKTHVIPEALELGLVSWFGGSQGEPAGYRYTNGSFVAVGGLNDPVKIMSTEYDVIYVQEAIELTPTDWENVTTRLRNGKISFQQLIADTNPAHPKHWLHQRVERGATTMLFSRHTDNPRLYDDAGNLTQYGAEYMAKLDNLTGVRKARLRDGKWVAAEGIVYESFDEGTHLVDRFDIPADWPRIWGIDFGFTNPFVLQCWAIDPDWRLILYREIYRTKRLVDDHARDILSHVRKVRDGVSEPDWRNPAHWEWIEPKPVAIVCDHDAEGRATFERAVHIKTKPANKNIKIAEGIQGVERRLAVQPDGRPRILFMRDSLIERDTELDEELKPCSTVEEFPGYVWPDEVRSGQAPKEAPVKVGDHGMDAMRYVVVDRDWTPTRARGGWL